MNRDAILDHANLALDHLLTINPKGHHNDPV
jgi:hypothetical protein